MIYAESHCIYEDGGCEIAYHGIRYLLVAALIFLIGSCSGAREIQISQGNVAEKWFDPKLGDVWIGPIRNGATSVDGDSIDVTPRLIHGEPPSYPSPTLAAKIEGILVLELIVDADGKVKNARVVSNTGTLSMEQSALEAAQKWQFRPAMRKNNPVDCKIEIPIHFIVR